MPRQRDLVLLGGGDIQHTANCADCEAINERRERRGLPKLTPPPVFVLNGQTKHIDDPATPHFCQPSLASSSLRIQMSNSTSNSSDHSSLTGEKENRHWVDNLTTGVREQNHHAKKGDVKESALLQSASPTTTGLLDDLMMRLHPTCHTILTSNPIVRIRGREKLKKRVSLKDFQNEDEGSLSGSSSRKRKLSPDDESEEYDVDKVRYLFTLQHLSHPQPVEEKRVLQKLEPPEFLVKWTDYSYEESTWEKLSYVKNCPEKIMEHSHRQSFRQLIAKKLKRAAERTYFSQGGALLYASPSFFDCHRWEDELCEITRACGQADIWVENWVDGAHRPKKFTFITSSLIPDETRKLFSPPRDLRHCQCTTECGFGKECCPRIFDSRYSYTPKARLRRNFDMSSNYIIECSSDCACSNDCPTKVVQRGRTIPVIIFRTPDRGWGVRTREKIKVHSFVTEYVGMVLGTDSPMGNNSATYQFEIQNRGSAKFIIDAQNYGNEARFVNHSCEPNMTAVKVFADRFDSEYLRIAYFANRDIEKGEELTLNYYAYMDNATYTKRTKRRKAKTCYCRAARCKGYLV